MRYLRGYKKNYFKLVVIAIYSSIMKLHKKEILFIFHNRFYKFSYFNKDPPQKLYINNKNIL